MSKFEEMCAAFGKARRDGTEYQHRCFQNLSFLVQGFSKYCEIPPESIQVVPVDQDAKKDTFYAIPGAAHFDPNDGFWHVGLVITLAERPNTFPRLRALTKVSVRERDGKVVVKRGGDDRPRELNLGDQQQCNEFYDDIVEHVKEALGKRLQDVAVKPSDAQTLGFKVEQ
jgi:hypothetical protein